MGAPPAKGRPAQTHFLMSKTIKDKVVVIAPDGCRGKFVGRIHVCRLEGCGGVRRGVRWEDGRLTYICTKDTSFKTSTNP